MNDAPSDHLRATYERRAELGYAKSAEQPDPTLDRKFEGVWSMVSSCLPCEAFLDAGCGDRRYLTAFASVSPRPRLVGVDIAERILATARSATEGVGLEVEYLQGNLEALPLEDASFDLVLCTQVIEHLHNPLLDRGGACQRGGSDQRPSVQAAPPSEDGEGMRRHEELPLVGVYPPTAPLLAWPGIERI